MRVGGARFELLERAALHYRQFEWEAASSALLAADADGALEADDLERLATVSYLLGREDDSTAAWNRAHDERLGAGDDAGAGRCAFWIAFGHMQRGEMAQAGGWLGRASAELQSAPADCAEHGYLLIPQALAALRSGQPEAALEAFVAAGEIGGRCGDPNLSALSLFGRGQTLIALGRTVGGIGLLDELMVSATGGEVSPIVVGLVYCGVIETCQDLHDVSRAREWTGVLNSWCQSQPDLVLYRGQCLVHRSEILQLQGEWIDAAVEAQKAVGWLSRPPPSPSVGAAHYREGEIHRLQGLWASADESYRQARKWGHEAQPGFALLQLAQGEAPAATRSIQSALECSENVGERLPLLPAAVEIMLAADDLPAARAAADELTALAAGLSSPYLEATALFADGSTLVAGGDPRAAVRSLRRAWTTWRHLETPYECARARVLIGRAYEMLGDNESAAMEVDAARWVFEELSARTDLKALDQLTHFGDEHTPSSSGAGHGLTGREVEVLAQIATGKTNRAIASELIISEKTVARHVANIFTKLGLSSRAAATAYAFQHDLV